MRLFTLLILLLLASVGHAQEITKTKLSQNTYDVTVRYLLEDIKQILETDLPDEQPEIYIASITDIQRAYCDEKQNCNVAAITDRKTGEIVVSTAFIPNNLISVSILFHELVHWVQVKKGMFKDETECMFWAKSEMHAYQAQSKFVAKYDGKGFVVPDLTGQCK